MNLHGIYEGWDIDMSKLFMEIFQYLKLEASSLSYIQSFRADNIFLHTHFESMQQSPLVEALLSFAILGCFEAGDFADT